MSDTVTSTPVEEPSSLLSQLAAAPVPAVTGESRRALSPSNVNQPAQSLKVAKDKQASDIEIKVAKESAKAVQVQRASGETRRSSATALKENAKEPRRRSPIVFPWTPRTRGTAVHTPSTSTDKAADAMLSSPPTVAATATHRQLQDVPSTIDNKKTNSGERASKTDTQGVGEEVINVGKEGEKSRWSPRTPTVSISTVTTAASTPPISPRPRTQEGPERSKSFATLKVSPRTPPPVSPRTMQKKNNAAESSDEDDRTETVPVSLEATSRPPAHLIGKTSDPVAAAAAPVKTSEESTATAKAAAESSHANPKSSTKAAEDNSKKPVAPLASPRQRAAPSLRSPSSSPSATTLEANASLHGTKSVARTASPSHKDVSPDAASTAAAPLATPRGASMASRVEEIRARLAASRPSSTAVTPRSSVGSVATSHVAAALPAPGKDSTNDSNVASVAAAAASVKEMKAALKDKEKELSQLAKDKSKVEQLLEKTTKKCEDVQAKWETEKTTFAAFKKEALAQKLEAQKEIRQAQATARTAQSQQEKLQREVERQKEKLMTFTSKATSTATTPMATPRGMPLSTDTSLVVDSADAATRAKLTRLEKENESLKQELEKLKGDAVATAKEQAAKEAESQKAAAQEAADALVKMKEEMASLADTLAGRDAAVKEKEEALSKVTAELDLVKRTHAEEQQREQEAREQAKAARADAETLTEASWTSAEASSTPPPSAQEAAPEPSPVRSPRQVVTFELSAKEATAQLQEELTATQCQVSAYKRMHDHAERRIEQLEAELESMQGRAREAVAALQQRIRADKEKERTSSSSDATALAAIKRELEKVRKDCEAFKQRAQESGEEAVTLQSALAEAEDERDVYERQVRELQAQQSKQEWEAKAAREKATTELTQARQALEERLESKEAELLTAGRQMQEKDATLKALEENVAAFQEQVKEAQAQVLAEAEAKKTAVDAYTKQVEHHKKKAKSLAKKLEESERELQLLGEEYTRVCGERDAAVLRYRTDNALPTASQPSHHEVQQQQQQQQSKESQKEEEAAGELSLQSDGVLTDNVSRDLSDALLSAKRGPTTHTTTTTTAVSAALAHEQAARVHLEKEVSALQSKVEAMAHMASPIMDSLLPDAIESLPSMDNGDDGDFLLPQQRGISSAPPRARSPQTTHALDLRFFDPTKGAKTSNTLDVETSARRKSWQQPQQQQHGVPSRSVSQSAAAAAASQRSPRRSQAPLSLSPRRGQHPFYTSAAASTAALGGEGGGVGFNAKGSALDALYAEVPLPPVYTNLMEKSSTLSGVSMPTLLFSTTAGSLLVSKRGRHLHRPVVAASSLPRSSMDRHEGSNHLSKTGKENEEGENVSSEACCAALTSMSHTIYASRMAAEGLFHLQHRYRFVLRVLTDCDEGDMLVGFADRYVPLESFGQKQNARRYKGCYYVNLRGGRLFAPSQNICGETYDGWRGAAETAAERRWAKQGGRICDGADRFSPSAAAASAVAGQPSLHNSPSRQSGVSAACVARAGDEIACVLRLDEKSISFEWNGVDCGVAFTCVSLSPSLYPCVEINCSGGTVELL